MLLWAAHHIAIVAGMLLVPAIVVIVGIDNVRRAWYAARGVLKPLVRLYHWFTGERLDYSRYYKMMNFNNLAVDPRAERRAHAKSTLFWMLASYLSMAGVMVWFEVQLHFDAALGPPIVNVIFPFCYPAIAWFLYTQHYHSDVFAVHIYTTTAQAGFAMVVSVLVSWGLGQAIFPLNRKDTSYLTTERGNSRWIYPEEMVTGGRRSLLPPDYDLIFGFTSSARIRHRKRVALRDLVVREKAAAKLANKQAAAAAADGAKA